MPSGKTLSKKFSNAFKRAPDALFRNWREMPYVRFLTKYEVIPSSALKYLGPRRQDAKPKKPGMPGMTGHVYGIMEERKQEIRRLKAPVEKKLAEDLRHQKELAHLYDGEMYPEGAPLRAVGL